MGLAWQVGYEERPGSLRCQGVSNSVAYLDQGRLNILSCYTGPSDNYSKRTYLPDFFFVWRVLKIVQIEMFAIFCKLISPTFLNYEVINYQGSLKSKISEAVLTWSVMIRYRFTEMHILFLCVDSDCVMMMMMMMMMVVVVVAVVAVMLMAAPNLVVNNVSVISAQPLRGIFECVDVIPGPSLPFGGQDNLLILALATAGRGTYFYCAVRHT